MGAIPAHPGPILVLSVPSKIGSGRAETDFVATSDGSFVLNFAFFFGNFVQQKGGVTKIPMSVIFPPTILRPEMAPPIFWAPGIFWLFLQENPHAHRIPLCRGGGWRAK